MNIGQRIKGRRKELKMSADELADKIGKDRSTIYRYEKGDIENLPLDILKPIASALSTTPQYLMGWEKADGRPGDMPRLLRFLRDNKVTRVMVPNHHREHIDHVAAHVMSTFNVPQAGDVALVDNGQLNAPTLLLWHSLQYANQKGCKIYDFTGSIMPQIETFIRHFGAEQTPYFYIEKQYSKIYSLLRKLKR